MDTLGSPLTGILREHLSGKPIDRSLWQKLDDSTRIRLSDAIVAVKSKAASEVRISNYDTQWPYLFSCIEHELREQLGALVLATRREYSGTRTCRQADHRYRSCDLLLIPISRCQRALGEIRLHSPRSMRCSGSRGFSVRNRSFVSTIFMCLKWMPVH
jgi:hypothetical protein